VNASILNFIPPTVDGREASELDARIFWQSRSTVDGKAPPLPELTDTPALARAVRACDWSTR
jgi:hypothetical protein